MMLQCTKQCDTQRSTSCFYDSRINYSISVCYISHYILSKTQFMRHIHYDDMCFFITSLHQVINEWMHSVLLTVWKCVFSLDWALACWPQDVPRTVNLFVSSDVQNIGHCWPNEWVDEWAAARYALIWSRSQSVSDAYGPPTWKAISDNTTTSVWFRVDKTEETCWDRLSYFFSMVLYLAWAIKQRRILLILHVLRWVAHLTQPALTLSIYPLPCVSFQTRANTCTQPSIGKTSDRRQVLCTFVDKL